MRGLRTAYSTECRGHRIGKKKRSWSQTRRTKPGVVLRIKLGVYGLGTFGVKTSFRVALQGNARAVHIQPWFSGVWRIGKLESAFGSGDALVCCSCHRGLQLCVIRACVMRQLFKGCDRYGMNVVVVLHDSL